MRGRRAYLQVREQALKSEAMGDREETYDAIRRMVAKLGDPYTRFLEPARYAALKRGNAGSLTGVGVEVGYASDGKSLVVPPPPPPRAGPPTPPTPPRKAFFRTKHKVRCACYVLGTSNSDRGGLNNPEISALLRLYQYQHHLTVPSPSPGAISLCTG